MIIEGVFAKVLSYIKPATPLTPRFPLISSLSPIHGGRHGRQPHAHGGRPSPVSDSRSLLFCSPSLSPPVSPLLQAAPLSPPLSLLFVAAL